MGMASGTVERDDARTLAERGLDFEDAVQVLAGTSLTVEDDRKDYGEKRFQTMGGSMTVLSWSFGPNETRHGTSSR